MNYPSLTPSQFVPSPSPLSDDKEAVLEEKAAKKKQKDKTRKVQKWLVLSCIFLLAATTFFYGKWSEYSGLYNNALPKLEMLEKYQATVRNYPFKIINPREGEQGTMPYYLMHFEAFVIEENEGELNLKIYKVSPVKLLKPGQAYIWKEMKEGVNQVPGVAYSCTAVFKNLAGEQTLHSFVFDNEKGIEFVPDFEKFTDHE